MRKILILIILTGILLSGCEGDISVGTDSYSIDLGGKTIEQLKECENITTYQSIPSIIRIDNKTTSQKYDVSRMITTSEIYEKCEPINKFRYDGKIWDVTQWGQCTINFDQQYIECDSNLDGNGDGICQKGESCIKKIIRDDVIETYYKNSGGYIKDFPQNVLTALPEEKNEI